MSDEAPNLRERAREFYGIHRGRLALGCFLGAITGGLFAPTHGLSVLLFLGLVGIGVTWRPALVLALVLVAPWVPSFIVGANEWSTSRPGLRFAGEAYPGHDNLDPESRCFREPSGFRLRRAAWIWDAAHNLGLRCRTAIVGWPPATYHGPYLQREEARILTDSGTITTETNFFLGKMQVGESVIQLPPALTQAMIADAGGILNFLQDDALVVRTATFHAECLLVRLTSGSVVRGEPSPRAVDTIYLLDRKRLTAFARYSLHGKARTFSLALHERWRR